MKDNAAYTQFLSFVWLANSFSFYGLLSIVLCLSSCGAKTCRTSLYPQAWRPKQERGAKASEAKDGCSQPLVRQQFADPGGAPTFVTSQTTYLFPHQANIEMGNWVGMYLRTNQNYFKSKNSQKVGSRPYISNGLFCARQKV